MNRQKLKKLILLMGGGGFTLPYSVDFSTLADGALPSPLSGITWGVYTGKAVNTPTEGLDLLTDGGLENWTSATDLTSWTETVSGTSTVNQETSVIHGGSSAARFDIDASNSTGKIRQNNSGFSIGDWVAFRVWAKSGTAGKTIITSLIDELYGGFIRTTTTSYVAYLSTARLVSLVGAKLNLEIYNLSATSASLYFDDISVKKITASTMFATLNALASDVIIKGAWNIVVGIQAGVIMNLDSVASPLNFVYLLHNGTANLALYKCVNGTHSMVYQNTGTAYVAGANIELRKTTTTTYQVWYNGSQVGADQTIDSAAINNNTIHGLISTGGGNTANSFFVG